MRRRFSLTWHTVSGVAGATWFSDDGQWSIQAVQPGGYRLYRKLQPVGEFPTVWLAQEAAEEATDE